MARSTPTQKTFKLPWGSGVVEEEVQIEAEWPLVVAESTRSQFESVLRLPLSPEVRGVVCATDAGREGELIFRCIYEAARATQPVRRV